MDRIEMDRVGSFVSGGLDDEFFQMKCCFSYSWVWQATRLNRVALAAFQIALADTECLKDYFRRMEDGEDLRIPVLPNTIGVAFLLSAMAIECLLKGVILRDHTRLASKGKMDRMIRTHDLMKLATLAGVDLSDKEEVYCALGTKAIAQTGRYPVGVNKDDTAMQTSIHQGAFTVYEGLYLRLEADLMSKPLPSKWERS